MQFIFSYPVSMGHKSYIYMIFVIHYFSTVYFKNTPGNERAILINFLPTGIYPYSRR
jgi:hypothetical protein